MKHVLIDALQAQLRALGTLVASLGEQAYRATPVSSSGSAGEHVRHCLDHARALVAGHEARERVVSYDTRERGTAVETDPRVAIDAIARLCVALEDIGQHDLTSPLWLEAQVERHAPPVRVATTLGRELAFVVQHTIHHCATLAVLLERIGFVPPSRFGYAPSTPDRRGWAVASR
jgi:uncharacterized damage-inducible protein DinB